MKGQDSTTRYPISMRPEQSIVHDGEMFGFSFRNNNLDISTPQKLLWITGSKEVHVNRVIVAYGGTCKLEVFVGPTKSNNGSEIASYNKNANSSNTAETKVYSGPTTSANGTQCFEPSYVLGAATTPAKSTGGSSDNIWRVLAPNTVYLVIITAEADNMDVVYYGDFTEH